MADNRTADPVVGGEEEPESGATHDLHARWEPSQMDAAEPDETWGTAPDEIAGRRARDIQVAEVMRRIGYDIKDLRAKALMEQLRQSSAGSLMSALDAGDLYARAKKLGAPFPPPEPVSWPGEAYAAVNEAAWSAAPRFVQGPLRRWDPSKGTSIATFYTNYVIGSDLKTRYCALQRQEARLRDEKSLDELYADGIHLPDPRDDVAGLLDRLEIEQILGELSPGQADLLRRVGQGEPVAHIARDLGVHPKTLGRQIQRLRERLGVELNRSTEGGGR